MAKSKKYTEPKVKTTGEKWFVWFRYLDEITGKMKLIVRKGGANYSGLSEKERMAQLTAAKKAILFKLEKQGWNPIANTYPKKSAEQIEAEAMQNMSLNRAIDFALSKCSVSTKTKLDYGTAVRFFKLAAEQAGINHLPVIEVKRQHIKMLIEKIKRDRKWSNHAFNKNLGYIGAVMDRLIEWEIIESNPAHNIKFLPVAESQMYVPLTPEEKKIIREYLFVNHYRFFVFLMVIYHTGIRPKEVLSLKIKDIAPDNSRITITPDLIAENSKTKKIRKVPVNSHLQPFLRELGLSDYPKEFYVFGSLGKRSGGRSKNGQGAMHPNYFKPSPDRIHRDTVTRLWKKIVKDDLKINKYQYAMKHTGADDKIMAGIDLDALKELYGHSSKMMTEKYVSVLKEIHSKKITELSPGF